MQRHAFIPAPSYEVLSSDWHETLAGGPDPVLDVNTRTVEPIPFNNVYYKPRSSDAQFGSEGRPSFLQLVYSLWWPGQSTWQEVHKPLTKTNFDQPLAAMPQGEQLALGLRTNIRQPVPFGQGALSDAAATLYVTEE